MIRFIQYSFVALLLLMSSCARNSSETWEDMKTAGRAMGRGVDSIWGKDYESKMLTSDEEFVGPYDDEFLPLRDSDLRGAFADASVPQAKGIPGQNGIPSLTAFYMPPDTLASLFKSIHFETDQHVIHDKGEIQALAQMATYLKKNPNVYIVVEGHADERAPATYNMALGMRRANYVRSLLVKHGADLNRIYTVSKGKEHPLALGHSPDDWRLNRRSEFKMYQK